MSIWSDLQDRSAGRITRSEDLYREPEIDFPIVKKVFPKIHAHDIVPVQPMSPPIGKLFYF